MTESQVNKVKEEKELVKMAETWFCTFVDEFSGRYLDQIMSEVIPEIETEESSVLNDTIQR